MEKEWQELKVCLKIQIQISKSLSFDVTNSVLYNAYNNILKQMEKLEIAKSLLEAGY